MSNAALPVPDQPNIPDIIEQYINGVPVATLAAEHGITRYTIYNWMIGHSGKDYHVQKVQAHVKSFSRRAE